MKRSGCKTVISLLVVQFVFLLSFSALADEVDKKFKEEFSASGKEMLKINNRYGEVIVENWNEDRVVIEVLVKVKYPSLDKAEKYLSMIDIEFSDNDNTIEATTTIDKNFSFKGGVDREFSIDYLVKMPTDLNLNLTNKYGKVEIGELSGHVHIAVKYGTLFVGKLSRGKEKPLNSVALSYGVAQIAESGWTELTLRYADKVTIGTAKALLVDSRYSKLYVEKVGSFVTESKYDHIEIANLNNFVAEGGFTGFELGNITGKLDITTGYGSIKVENIASGFEDVNIESKYCKIKLQFEEQASYLLNVETSYAPINFDEDNAEIIQRIYENSRKTIEARVGASNSESKVKIKANYGTVIVN